MEKIAAKLKTRSKRSIFELENLFVHTLLEFYADRQNFVNMQI